MDVSVKKEDDDYRLVFRKGGKSIQGIISARDFESIAREYSPLKASQILERNYNEFYDALREMDIKGTDVPLYLARQVIKQKEDSISQMVRESIRNGSF